MKLITWLGDSRKAVRRFSDAARYQTGKELFRLQVGENALDAKPMRPVGPGVSEIRIHAETEYRVLYVAKFAEAIYVLHAFTKKTPATSLTDVRIGKHRYREMIELRKAK